MSALPKPELMYNNDENMRDHQFSNDNSDSTSPGPRELVKEWYPFTYDLGTDVQDRYRHAETDYSGPASNESYGAAAFQPSDHVQPSMARRYSTESYLSHELASDGMSHDSTNLPLRNYNHTYQEHVPASSHNGSMWNNGARAIYDGRFDCVADRYGYMPLTQPYAAYQSHVSAPYLVPGARGRSMSYLPSLAMQLPDPAYRSDLSGPPDYSFHLGSSEQLKRASSSSSSSTTRRHNSTSSSEQAPKKICSNCRTDQTPSWRRDSEGKELLCNACGLYQKLHKRPRPIYIAADGTMKVARGNNHQVQACDQCQSVDCSIWRRVNGSVLCNPCGLNARRAQYSYEHDMSCSVSLSRAPLSPSSMGFSSSQQEYHLFSADSNVSQDQQVSGTSSAEYEAAEGCQGSVCSSEQRLHGIELQQPCPEQI